MFDLHCTLFDARRAPDSIGINNPIRIAMIARTTSSSISEKAWHNVRFRITQWPPIDISPPREAMRREYQ
jgi:hypothetical protein